MIKMNIVTLMVEHLTVNFQQHPDLVWVLHGNDKHTCGVLTSVMD
jgi:hypothetical protein